MVALGLVPIAGCSEVEPSTHGLVNACAAFPSEAHAAHRYAWVNNSATCCKLAEASFAGAWAGLRPATPSGNPILGPVDGWDGLLLATGHFRNGVLLSAITGKIISDLVLGEPSPTDISPFLYERL